MAKGNPNAKPWTGDKKPTQRQRARELLLEGRTVLEVATAVVVAPSTVYKWRRDKGFVERLQAEQESRLAMASDRLRSWAGEALDVMRELMNDTKQPGAVRLKAATEIADRAGITNAAEKIVIAPVRTTLTAEDIEAAKRWLADAPSVQEEASNGDD